MAQDSRLLRILLAWAAAATALAAASTWWTCRSLESRLDALSVADRARLLAEAERVTPGVYQSFPPSGPLLFYHLAPQAHHEARFGVSFETNEIGFRSRPVSRAGDSRRILVVGDSWTFGPSVDRPFTAVLEDLLQTGTERWEVHNLSMMGWNTKNEIEALHTFISRIRPDIVVICPTSNDIDEGYAVWRGRLVTVGFESAALFRYSYEYEHRWIDAFKRLDREARLLEERGIPTLVYFLAEWRRLAPYYASRSGFSARYTVVPTPFIDSHYRLTPDVDPGRHASPEGHRLIGTFLYNALLAADIVGGDHRPAPLAQVPVFPGHEFSEVEEDFGFWWPYALRPELIPSVDGRMRQSGLFSTLASRATRDVVVRFRLLEDPGLYPLEVVVRLSSPEPVPVRFRYRRYEPGVQEVTLEKPSALDPYPIVEAGLNCSRAVPVDEGWIPVCLEGVEISAR